MLKLSAIVPLLLSGCYLVRQGEGQLTILLGARPISEVLADPDLDPRARRKLELILEIKEFGERQMGLAASTNYTRYFDTGGRPVSYIVSACRKDRFQPHTWWFPIVGEVPYKGFFRREDAAAEAEELARLGYDVSVGAVAAYSTLGWFPDPVFSTMLDDSEEELASLILHELTHLTLYVPGDTDFNESLATFVGRQGALEFVRWRFGAGSPLYDRAIRSTGFAELRDARNLELFRKLDDLYRSETLPDRKLELRDLVAGFPVNNAEILMQRRYGRYDEFRPFFEDAGGDWPLFWARIRRRAALLAELRQVTTP
jgi:predicted aminopeptidase